MHTPILNIENIRSVRELEPNNPTAEKEIRDKSLLIMATELAIISANENGHDLPVGAVAAGGDLAVGQHYASDRRLGVRQMHAEYLAVQDAILHDTNPRPDTIVATIEPCDDCQDYLATIPTVKRVGFGLSRTEVSDRGIVKPHAETIFQRAERISLPYEVIQIQDPFWQEVGRTILDNVRRNPITEIVAIDTEKLDVDLAALEYL